MYSEATVLLAAVVVIGCAAGGHPVCNVAAPDFQSCVRSAIQHLIPELSAGSPSIGAAGVEPLQGLPPVIHNSGGLRTQLDNVVISGLSATVINDANADLATNTIRVQATVPGQLTLTGVQTTDADIMGIPLRGSGPFTLTLSQPSLDLTLTGVPTAGPDGQTYLQLTSATASVQPGVPSIDVKGFFSHFPPLEHAANAFANSVAAPVVQDMLPSLNSWLGGVALERAQAVFSSVPYDVIFPGRTPAAVGLYRAFAVPSVILRSYHK